MFLLLQPRVNKPPYHCISRQQNLRILHNQKIQASITLPNSTWILKELTGHENVVQFYNAFEDNSYVYIVMELCEDGELLDRILGKKDSRYTEKDAAVVVWQMLKVAAECHLHGLVHRDMKPEVCSKY
ncbi:Calcium-dependent protein kinase 18 [Trifolium repens]|nr:Calcium-dependent protein kinase 18 [Trifolium repens]